MSRLTIIAACALGLALASCITTVPEPTISRGEVTVKNEVQNCVWPSVQGLENKQLEAEINRQIRDAAMILLEEFASEAAPERTPQYIVSHQTSRHGPILSVRLDEFFMSRMLAHPADKIVSLTIDLENGRVYQLPDLFLAGRPWQEQLNGLIREKIGELGEESLRLLGEYRGVEEGQAFYLTDKALVIYYQTYAYTTRPEGPLEFHIPFSRLRDQLAVPLGG
jgi:hypothetical protein